MTAERPKEGGNDVVPPHGIAASSSRRRFVLWAGLAIGWLLPSVGCQVEYAGMTLPSGKYMHDDVQYFPPGPDFPWANTQAATQRARMQAMGIEAAPGGDGPGARPAGPGGDPPAPEPDGPADRHQLQPVEPEPPVPDAGPGGAGPGSRGPGHPAGRRRPATAGGQPVAPPEDRLARRSRLPGLPVPVRIGG